MRILIAEDHEATRLILEAAVRSLGHDCVAANDGEEAWQLFVPSLRSPLKHSTHRKCRTPQRVSPRRLLV
jgi:hypothetical protein